jgi:hypothetical protein
MRTNSLKITVLAASVVALATLGAGLAPAAVVAPGDLGGGALLAEGRYGTGNILIALRVAPDDRVRIDVDLQVSCAGETFVYNDYALTTVAVIAPDATFTATGTRSEDGFGSDAKLAYEITGSFTPTGASGAVGVSIPADYPISVPGCPDATSFSSGPIAWQARRPTAPGTLGAPGPFAGAMLYGTTTQRVRRTRGAIVLRVAPDGRRFERAAHLVKTRCMRRRVITPGIRLQPATGTVYYDAPVAIRRDGSFVNRQQAILRTKRIVNSASTRLAGNFGTLGATGSLRYEERVVTTRTRRLRERCYTPAGLRWSAAP